MAVKSVNINDKGFKKAVEALERLAKMQVKVGDKVIYSKYAGTEVELDKEEYIVVKQNDILAVIE